MTIGYLTAAEVAKNYRWSLAYVYRQAARHKWRRYTLDGRVRYFLPDIDACRDLPRSKVPDTLRVTKSVPTARTIPFLPGLNRVPNRPTAPQGAGHGVGRVPAGVPEAVLRLPHKSRTGINFGRP